MQYSPKLKKVMKEIETILKKNDVAGMVVLHDVMGHYPTKEGGIRVNGFSEELFHINTSYAAHKEKHGAVIVKGKKKHYVSTEERDTKVAASANMFTHFVESGERLIGHARQLKTQVDKAWKPEYDQEGGYTSHQQQNN